MSTIIEEGNDDYEEETSSCCRCFCCSREAQNPDLNKKSSVSNWEYKAPYYESGYLVPGTKKPWHGKTLEMLRATSLATRMLPGPLAAIAKNNKRGSDDKSDATAAFDMNVVDVNNLLRRRLSLRVLVNEEDESGEIGEALLPKKSNFSEAAPLLLSKLVRETSSTTNMASSSSASLFRRRSSVFKADVDKVRASVSLSRQMSIDELTTTSIDEKKSDKEFIDYLLKTSQFMKEALEKDWPKTKAYIKWLENYINSPKFKSKAQNSMEKWMVVLYTSSEDSRDQLCNFRCMLVRLLLQHHCILYEERDVMLPHFQHEFKDRLASDMMNIPQVYMQGLNIGGYRVMFGIHKLGRSRQIFNKFIKPREAYAEWMFHRENKSNTLTLDVNLKAFPALQALAGSWSNDKLSPHHLEFVTMGKFVVRHGRERWYNLSSRPYIEPDLYRYALLRLTIIHALCAMNKIYKQYLNKITTEGDAKLKRKLSWLPRFSKQLPKD